MNKTPTCMIVDTDNFGGDYPDEKLQAICFCSLDTANKFADAMNSETASRYYKVVPLDYKLQPGFKP